MRGLRGGMLSPGGAGAVWGRGSGGCVPHSPMAPGTGTPEEGTFPAHLRGVVVPLVAVLGSEAAPPALGRPQRWFSLGEAEEEQPFCWLGADGCWWMFSLYKG